VSDGRDLVISRGVEDGASLGVDPASFFGRRRFSDGDALGSASAAHDAESLGGNTQKQTNLDLSHEL